MKKINFILLFVFSIVVLNSCDSKDDTKDYVQSNLLVGSWKIKTTGELNNVGGVDFQNYVNSSDCNDDIIFNQDLTFAMNKYTKVGNDCIAQSTSGTYTLSNHNLEITTVSGGVTIKKLFVITELTNTDLEYNYNDDLGNLVFITLKK
jgi:hypothetical protein